MINNCLAAFLKSFQLIKFCRTHNKKHISEIHVNFVNMNQISAMIYKTHLDYWFEECDFKNLVQEYHLNHLEKDYQYIQQIYNEDFNQMIICFFIEQTYFLFFQRTFKMNMIFKRVKMKNMNEVILMTYVEKMRKDI